MNTPRPRRARAASDADGSVGRALAAESEDLVEARAVAHRLLEQTARVSDPVRRLEAVKDLGSRKSSAAGERDQLAACLRALASLLRDIGILAIGADRRMLGNADLESQLEPLARAFNSRRSTSAYAPSTGARRAGAQRQPEGGCRLARSATVRDHGLFAHAEACALRRQRRAGALAPTDTHRAAAEGS